MKVLIHNDCDSKERHELPQSFPHQAPNGYEYRAIQFKRSVISIWTVYQRGFVYNDHSPSYCIWGFYDTKTGKYHAPINSTKVGDIVDVKSTTPYTAMPLHLNPLQYALYA